MNDTIAALATPLGRSAVGIVRLSGPHTNAILKAITGARLPRPRMATLRRILDADGTVLDHALVLRFRAPASYTGEDMAEIHAHGSPVILERILSRLYALGARPAAPGEFTRRAVEHGKMDLTQAEAVAAAIEASTLRAAKEAQKQLAGALGKRIEQWLDRALDFTAHLEAWLDFPDEDIPPPFWLVQALRETAAEMRALLGTADLGERLFKGVSLAIVGEPNVGKSSLLNRLLGEQRAIVSAIPGTTRDLVEADLEIAGVPVRLVDTAGLRASADPIEAEGIKRAQAALARADFVLLVVDATDYERKPMLARKPDLLVFNKADLLSDAARTALMQSMPSHALLVSAKTGAGIARLEEALAALVAGHGAEGADVLITRARQRDALARAAEALESASEHLEKERVDLAAMEVRRGWTALSELLGVGDVEEILDRVFASFCIGK